jgi:hypothetical protein
MRQTVPVLCEKSADVGLPDIQPIAALRGENLAPSTPDDLKSLNWASPSGNGSYGGDVLRQRL